MVASHSPPSLLTSSAVFAAIAACASAVYTFSPPPHAVFLTCTSSVLAILALLTADPPMFLAILLVNPVTRVIVPRALVDYTRRHDLALAVAVEGMRERDRAATEAASAAAAAEAAQTQLASFGAFPSEDDASPGAASTRVPTGEVPVRMVLREVARRMCWRFMVPCTLASMALQVITLLKPKYIGDVFDKIVRSDATMDSVRIRHQSQPNLNRPMARFYFRELLVLSPVAYCLHSLSCLHVCFGFEHVFSAADSPHSFASSIVPPIAGLLAIPPHPRVVCFRRVHSHDVSVTMQKKHSSHLNPACGVHITANLVSYSCTLTVKFYVYAYGTYTLTPPMVQAARLDGLRRHPPLPPRHAHRHVP